MGEREKKVLYLAHMLYIYSNLLMYEVFGPVHDQYLGPESRSKEILVSVSMLPIRSS